MKYEPFDQNLLVQNVLLAIILRKVCKLIVLMYLNSCTSRLDYHHNIMTFMTRD